MIVSPPKTSLFGMPVQIMDGLPADTIIIGNVTLLLQAGRPCDAVIDGIVIKLGEAHGES